ncbi:MAG TPA: ABC transporter permease [Thermoanaerobaculia bacterium]|nr:ABC transporter permease [Thermoanaerobaculia bacterium]
MEKLLRDLRFALRMLARSPGSSAAAVLCLALAIGATTAVFSFENAVLLRGLPYRDAQRIFIVWNQFLANNDPKEDFSIPEFLDLREQAKSFAQLAATRPGLSSLTGDGDPELLVTVHVSPDLFRLLGVSPGLGRWFLPEEERPGRDQVAILSHELWQRHFSSDPGVIGRKVIIDSQPYTVVGVTAEGFYFRRKGRDLWLPLTIDQAAQPKRDNRNYEIYARPREGLAPAAAQAELDTIASQFARDHPESYPASSGYGMKLASYRDEVIGDSRPALLLLGGAVALVLLIACANVANLLMARATTRDREVAVRIAFGAGRPALLRQFLVESLLLALAGGALGLVLAAWGVRLTAHMNIAKLPRLDEVSIDANVLLFTLAVTVLTGVLFGFAPAFQALRGNLLHSLKQGGRGGSEGAERQLPRRLLVVVEVAVALMVLVGAGLLVQSFVRMARINPGYNPHDVLTLELFLPAPKYPDKTQRVTFWNRLVERLDSLPGVVAAATVNAVPLGKVQETGDLEIEGLALKPGQPAPQAAWRICSPDYFRTMGTPLAEGRFFTPLDNDQAQAVAIVDRGVAKRFWPGTSPIGKRLKMTGQDSAGEWRTIVGVVGDVKHVSFDADSPPHVYAPLAQYPRLFQYVVIRTNGDPAALARAARAAVREIDRDQAVFRVESMDEKVAITTAWRRFYTALLGCFAVVALALAMVGVYGVTAFSVAQRRREIGIRMALGARRGSVLGLVLGQALLLAGLGVALGLAAALALVRVAASLLFGVSATDLGSFAGGALLLVALAIVASWLPARRASRLDPVLALAAE